VERFTISCTLWFSSNSLDQGLALVLGGQADITDQSQGNPAVGGLHARWAWSNGAWKLFLQMDSVGNQRINGLPDTKLSDSVPFGLSSQFQDEDVATSIGRCKTRNSIMGVIKCTVECDITNQIYGDT
jgi:hypothetical protein